MTADLQVTDAVRVKLEPDESLVLLTDGASVWDLDRDEEWLRLQCNAIAEHLGVEPERILVLNGVTGLRVLPADADADDGESTGELEIDAEDGGSAEGGSGED